MSHIAELPKLTEDLEFLRTFKATKANKAALTKDIKALKETVSDLEEAKQRQKTMYFWHHGLMYTNMHINKYKRILHMYECYREQLDGKSQVFTNLMSTQSMQFTITNNL